MWMPTRPRSSWSSRAAGSGAPDAREQRFGGRRRRSGAGRIGCGGLGADGGGKRDIGRHVGSILGGVGERPGGALPAPPGHALAAAPLDLPDGSRHAGGVRR